MSNKTPRRSGLLNSHLWKQLKRPLMKDRPCYVCKGIIRKGTRMAWKYNGVYRVEYAHPQCINKFTGG